MALTIEQKHLIAMMAQRNPDADYMIQLSSDSAFALSELAINLSKLKEELIKEKNSHESHIITLNTRLERIAYLLSALENPDITVDSDVIV